MSNLRISFIKQLILLMLCIKGLYMVAENFNVIDEISIVMNIDTEDTESEEKLELKEFNKITHRLHKNSMFLNQQSSGLFNDHLLFYKDYIVDFQTPPPEKVS